MFPSFAPDITVWFAFTQGFLSFLSPCILPLLPVYLGYLAGATIDEVHKNQRLRRTMWFNSLGFVLGISIVFVGLGAGASALGQFLNRYYDLLRKIGAILIIIFGTLTTGIIKLDFMNMEKRFHYRYSTPKFLNAFLLGATFSFGWTPCIGPALTSILILAGNANSYGKSMLMLFIYSLGMTVPFLITSLIFGWAIGFSKKIYKYFNIIKIISGALLIIMGIAMYFNWLTIFAQISY